MEVEAQQRVKIALRWLEAETGVTLDHYVPAGQQAECVEALHVLGLWAPLPRDQEVRHG